MNAILKYIYIHAMPIVGEVNKRENLYQKLSHILHCTYRLLFEIFNIDTRLNVLSYLKEKGHIKPKKTKFIATKIYVFKLKNKKQNTHTHTHQNEMIKYSFYLEISLIWIQQICYLLIVNLQKNIIK